MPLCAEVSAGAFCRRVVARVAMQDPEAVSTIKVSPFTSFFTYHVPGRARVATHGGKE